LAGRRPLREKPNPSLEKNDFTDESVEPSYRDGCTQSRAVSHRALDTAKTCGVGCARNFTIDGRCGTALFEPSKKTGMK